MPSPMAAAGSGCHPFMGVIRVCFFEHRSVRSSDGRWRGASEHASPTVDSKLPRTSSFSRRSSTVAFIPTRRKKTASANPPIPPPAMTARTGPAAAARVLISRRRKRSWEDGEGEVKAAAAAALALDAVGVAGPSALLLLEPRMPPRLCLSGLHLLRDQRVSWSFSKACVSCPNPCVKRLIG